MKEIIQHFGRAKSPLGVIGLFVTLVYLIAGIVFQGIILCLNFPLQWVLILFIVSYPYVLLAIFFILVTKHSDKLYAPIDFRSDDGFHKYRNIDAAEKTVLQYDPNLKAEVDRSKEQGTSLSTNPLASIIGKESLALGAMQNILEKKYGKESIRTQNTGFGDFVIMKGRDRVHVDIKLISPNSPLQEIALASSRWNEAALYGSNTGSRDREYVLYLVIDAEKDLADTIKERFRLITRENKYNFTYIALSFDELINSKFHLD